MAPVARADRVSVERWGQAESPRWTGGDEVCWVDMATATFVVGRFSAGSLDIVRRETVGRRIGSAARIRDSDDWVVSADRSVLRLRPDGTRSTVAELPAGPGFANDGVCDPSGRFWTGTQTADRSPHAALYSLGDDGVATERLGGLTVSNGLCFSSDGRTLFHIDTLPDRAVDAFDVAEDGTLSGRRRLFAVAGGNPDGMAIDDDGALWVAVWGAGEVRRYAPDGRLLATVAVPAARVSAVALIGPVLLITTAVDPAAGARDQGGHLFAAQAPVAGAPASRAVLP